MKRMAPDSLCTATSLGELKGSPTQLLTSGVDTWDATSITTSPPLELFKPCNTPMGPGLFWNNRRWLRLLPCCLAPLYSAQPPLARARLPHNLHAMPCPRTWEVTTTLPGP